MSDPQRREFFARVPVRQTDHAALAFVLPDLHTDAVGLLVGQLQHLRAFRRRTGGHVPVGIFVTAAARTATEGEQQRAENGAGQEPGWSESLFHDL